MGVGMDTTGWRRGAVRLRFSLRWLVPWLVGSLVMLCLPVAAGAEEASSDAPSLQLGSEPFVILSSPVEASQRAAERTARINDPADANARLASRTRYEHVDASAQVNVAETSYGHLLNSPDGGTPTLPQGERIVRYISDHAATLQLPGHRVGVLETMWPIAVHRSRRYVPTNLSVTRVGETFRPKTPTEGLSLQVPSHLSAGISLTEARVSLTPVNEHGAALAASSGSPIGASVFYGTGAADTAVAVKPTTFGFDLRTLIYSAHGPDKLYFRVGLPQDTKLIKNGSGAVQALSAEGRAIATITPPSTQDAEGTVVPTSTRVAGDLLEVIVNHKGGGYLYPLIVDPEVTDPQLATTSSGKRSNWEFHSSNEARFGHKAVYEGLSKEYLETTGTAVYAATEWAYWGYETKGNSKIYEIKTLTSAKNTGAKIESFLEFQYEEASKPVSETKVLLSTEVEKDTEYSGKSVPLCAANAKKEQECLPGAGKEKNAVRFQQSATGSPGESYKFSDTLNEGIVYLSEPTGTHSTTSYNTGSAEVEGEVEVEGRKVRQKRINALYGPGSWLTKSQGALELQAKDLGIGVSRARLEYEKAGKWEQLFEHAYLESENACQGVQCYNEHGEYWTLDPKLPDGEDKIRYRAEEAMSGTTSLEGEGVATVKVDTKAPYNVFLHGLPWGQELSEKPYKLTAEATDGEGAVVASSGIQTLKLFISGREITEVGKQAGCKVAKGQCTASAEWSINGSELGAGHHAIVVVATDNAGNEARIEDTLSVRHSTPISMGPGSVDLQSGDFALGTTDVSLGSGLTLSRTFSSRDLTQGEEGPLGPQWAISMGSVESLIEMVDGSVLLTSGNGSQTIFAKTETTTYESPQGDSNLTLKVEENTNKHKIAYYLENHAAGTKVKFTLPIGSKAWVPTSQEGTVATDTVTYRYQSIDRPTEQPKITEYALAGSTPDPYSITAGPDGNVWFTEFGQSKISKITSSGSITEYACCPWATDITQGPDKNLWYTNNGNSRIGKLTTAGASTEYALPAESKPGGITSGPDNNLWFVDNKTNKVGKITTTGAITEYNLPAGSAPENITTGPDGNLWFTDSASAKIGKITTAGVVTEYALPALSTPSGIVEGADGNLWFTEYKADKIGKMSTTGAVTEYALPEGSKPYSITQGADGNLWFTDYGTNKIGRATLAGTVTEYSLPASSGPYAISDGPEGNIWFTDMGSQKVGKLVPPRTVLQPLEARAPVPAKVSCSPMKAGCRALKFEYAQETSAKGEKEAEWGEYAGNLKRVSYEAYNPSTKEVEHPVVAEYKYDGSGRLRAEWDPRISPALKTTYGYDEEGHVTALTQPGQESWAFTYGTITGDAGTGRLLKTTQAPASAELWNGKLPEKLEGPKVTGSALVGIRLAMSNGVWVGSPVSYGYKWEDCNSEGSACTTIPGANNPNYTIAASDTGHTIRAVLTATNGGGTVAATSAATAMVSGRDYTQTIDSGTSINAVTCIPATTDCAVSDGKGKALYATNVSASSAATWTSWTGPGPSPSEAMSCPSTSLCLVAAGSNSGYGGSMYYATSLGGPWTLAYSPTYGVDAISCVSTSFCVDGQDNFGYFRYATNPASTSWNLEEQGSSTMKAVFCLSSSFCVIGDSTGHVHIATSTTQVESSAWTETDVDGSSALNGVSCVTTTSCVVVDGAGNVVNLAVGTKGEAAATKHNIDGTNSLVAVACPTSSVCVTVDNAGNAFVSTNGGETWTNKYQLEDKPTSVACASSSLCVTGDAEGKVTTFNPTATVTEGEVRPAQQGSTLEYGVPLTGGAGLQPMTSSDVAKWGQQEDAPEEATAVIPPDSPQGWPASSYTRATTYYLDSKGRTTNVSLPSTAAYGSITTSEYNQANDVTRTLSPDNREAALKAGAKSVEVAHNLDTENTYNGEGAKELEAPEPGTRLIETLGPQHMVKYMAGKEMKESLARSHVKYFYDENAPSTGETYNLITKQTELAQLANEEEVEVRKTATDYSGQNGLGWKLRAPTSITSDPEGKKLTHTTLYNGVTGQVIERRGPGGLSGESAHDSKTIYYSSEANTEGFTACGNRPEWSGLVCETLPAKQPGTVGLPKLPVTTLTYNMWNEVETQTETFPASEKFAETRRTKTNSYDSAGRLTSSETTSTSTENKSLPRVSFEYSTVTGMLEKQSDTVEGKTKTITSIRNKLLQLTSYTDADGNTAKYVYGGTSIDGMLQEMTDSSNAGGSKQVYTYNATTKQLESLVDSAAGTFTAIYDAEGRMISELYPNEMCGNTAYNAVGEATHIEYLKTGNCAETSAPNWFNETKTESVHGAVFTRISTLAKETYAYDTAGEMTEVQEEPVGSGCSVRAYTYDEESNRTSLTVRQPGTGGACATEGGTLQSNTYDEANRLNDVGIEYDRYGNITKLPAADAEGHELTTTFYIDNAVASQTQNGVTNTYGLDPAGRVDETTTGGKLLTTHYDAPGDAVAWTSESGSAWTRNIPGIDGSLSAIQTNGASPVLQLHDLEGNIVATAELSKEATKLLSTYNSTEFGVPNGEKAPPPYAWLGGSAIASSLPSGVITYGATSYVPQTGRSLQTEVVEPPGAPGGTGAGTPYSSAQDPWVMQGAAAEGAQAPGLEAGREREAAEAACRANIEACDLEITDPHWVWHLTYQQSLSMISAIEAVHSWSLLDIGADIKTLFKIDFVKQVENWIITKATGINPDDVKSWSYKLSSRLEECTGLAFYRWLRPRNPYCWVYIRTNAYAIKVPFVGIVLYEFELPNFKEDAQVAYCPHGEKGCYAV